MTYSKNGDKRIESLQALRAIAFIGIFLSHAGSPFKWPTLGVSVFYVMSGFLMMYRHVNDDFDCSFKNRMRFSLNRIKKLYPLHIVTMIFAILLAFAIILLSGITKGQMFYLVSTILLNVFLVQTWIPNSLVNVSLNGVAWYLSVTMFLYFMFPIIHRYIKKQSMKKLWLICFCLLAVQYISCIPWIHFVGGGSPAYIWFMYCFPVFRIGDFFVGCTLGNHYAKWENSNYSYGIISFIEVIMTIVPIGVYKWLEFEQNNIFLLALQNRTTIFIPIAAIWVYLFVINKGIITKALANRYLIYLGNISAYSFLIHYVVTQYTNQALIYLHIELPMNIKMLVILAEFALTILLTLMYKRMNKIYSQK